MSIAFIQTAEFSGGIPLLDASQAHIHEDEHGEHRQGQQGRPLKQEAEHHKDEADVLGMTHVAINASRDQLVLSLALIECLPAYRYQQEARTDEAYRQLHGNTVLLVKKMCGWGLDPGTCSKM
mgnify:CR=1 FL=1